MTRRARPEVVITGVGLRCAAGTGLGALSVALREDRACLRPANTPLPVPLVAACPDDVTEHPDLPDDRKSWLALAALDEAVDAAGLQGHWPAPARRGLFLGTGLSSVTPGELAEDVYPYLSALGLDEDAVAADISPDRAAPRRHMPGRCTQVAAARLDVRGPTRTSFSACAAAAQAQLAGLRALQRGEVDVALVGGHDSMLHPLGMLSFVVLGALSPTRCRPFDRSRNGFVLGEAAAVFVLERRTDAEARGASILATFLGGGTSADGHNVTAPQPEGLGAEQAMRRALDDAGLAPDAVDGINAHGTGTPVGDRAEAQAIARVFGADTTVCSTKGALGHAVAAAGALEAAVCVAALQEGLLPGTVGLQEVDPAFGIGVQAAARQGAPRVLLSNSFGFGGQNASLVFAAAD